MYVKFDGDRAAEAKFEGTGCAISQAAASMLTEYLKGKTKHDLQKADLKTVQSLLKVKVGAGRIDCALLPVQALRQAKNISITSAKTR